jgi:pimeloyl-ACP methyl ester carboxylesterase
MMRPVSISLHGQPTTGWRSGPEGATPAVLLHGVPTDARLFSRLPALLPDRALLALDLPGYGGTAPLPIPTLSAYTDWLTAALSALDLTGPLRLVGQDYGGLLAALHAAQHGAASLTLTSAPTGLLWLIPRLTALPGLHRYFYQHHGGGLYLHHGVCDGAREAFLETFGGVVARPELPGLMRQTAQHLSARTLWPLTRRLAGVDTLCLWGAADRFNPPATARWTAKRLSGRCVLVDGGRHYVPFGQAGAYAAVLSEQWG